MGKASDYRRRIEGVLAKRCPAYKKDKEGYPWPFIRSRFNAAGGCYELRFKVPNGYSCLDAEKHVDAFYAACGAVVDLVDHAGEITIKVFPDDFPDMLMWDDKYLDLLRGEEFVVGFTRDKVPVKHSLAVNPHFMEGGAPGYGKTDALRIIVYQLVRRFSADRLQFHIVDMKGFSFFPFRNLPHVQGIARTLADAADMIQDVYDEMIARENMIYESGNRALAQQFPRIVLLIDEAAQIAPKLMTSKEAKKLALRCDENLAKIAMKGRELRVGVWYCTQRPDADTVNPGVKACMEASIAFRCKTETNSRIILDRGGAEKLPAGRPGRAIYAATEDYTVQVPYVGKDDAWEALLMPYIPADKVVIECETTAADVGREVEEVEQHFADLFGAEGDYNEPSGADQLSWEWFPAEASVRTNERATRVRFGRRDEEQTNARSQTLATD